MPCPTTPVVPRTTGELNVAVGTLQETNAPQQPVQHLPKENCLSPTREALPARNHAPTMTRPGSCKPFSTIPVVPRRTGEVNVVVAVLKKKSAPPRPVQHLPKENCLGLLRRSLPAGNPGRTAPITHGPTRFLWTTPHHCGRRGHQKSLVGVSTSVACCNDGTRNTVQTTSTNANALAGLDKMTSIERATRRGQTRTGGRHSCTLMVWFLFVATLLMVDVVGAVFAPVDKAALKAAVGTCYSSGCTGGCLGETADGSCPIFAASNVPSNGVPYGVISDWDVSAVTDMSRSKCNLPVSVATPSAVVHFNIRQLEFHPITILTRFCYFYFVCLKRYSF